MSALQAHFFSNAFLFHFNCTKNRKGEKQRNKEKRKREREREKKQAGKKIEIPIRMSNEPSDKISRVD